MKTLGKKTTAWLIAILALSFTYSARCDDPQSAPANPPNQDSASAEGIPMKCNKASGLIGMEVRNQDNEHLGRIKDVVFDLKNERVSYVVLTTSPKVTLGIDEKLLAVPLSAFTPAADSKYLILNADKSKVDSAKGFSKNNWPDVTNPSWGAQPFWQNTAQPANPNNNPNQPGYQSPRSGTRPGEQGNPPQSQ